MEDYTVRDPTACEEMEHCHFLNLRSLLRWRRSRYRSSKYLCVCVVIPKTATYIAEGIFDQDVNNCIVPQFLERKISIMENDECQIYNKNTVIPLIRESVFQWLHAYKF